MSNGRKPTFFTSDWHIGHENSIKFDKRPFKDLDEMHSFLIRNYNATVPENGICYFLGDVGLASSEKTKEVISKLHGTKVLILGNHDKGINAMYQIGFDVVLYNATLYIAQQKVTMSHCPLPGIVREKTDGMHNAIAGDCWHGESRHQAYTVANEGQFHLHGHIHSPNNGKSEKTLGRQYDVGVPNSGYRPVSTSTIEAWISSIREQEALKEIKKVVNEGQDGSFTESK